MENRPGLWLDFQVVPATDKMGQGIGSKSDGTDKTCILDAWLSQDTPERQCILCSVQPLSGAGSTAGCWRAHDSPPQGGVAGLLDMV